LADKVGEIFWLAYRQKINNYEENRLAFELKPLPARNSADSWSAQISSAASRAC